MAVLECHDVCMHFGAWAALDMVSFTLGDGEIRGMRVFENVLVGALHGGRMNMVEARREAEEVIEFVGLADQSHKLSGEISVPARRRLELARALATRSKVLLLDENMAGLNPFEIDEALER